MLAHQKYHCKAQTVGTVHTAFFVLCIIEICQCSKLLQFKNKGMVDTSFYFASFTEWWSHHPLSQNYL